LTATRAAPATRVAAFALMLVTVSTAAGAPTAPPLPERISFPSADGSTTLIGYAFTPSDRRARTPAVVMMHGRGGAYSSLANGRYDAATLSQRHLMWGRLWAARGYLALLVDGFGPRGHPQGFARGSYRERAGELSEVTVRPLDAYGALAWLRARPDVAADRVALQGWSNGGSAVLAAMSPDATGLPEPGPGFRAALVLYPGCGLQHRFDRGYRPYAPVRLFMGTADEEVSAKLCKTLVERSRAEGGDIALELYPGATHGFDDPGGNRQGVKANADAKADAMARAERFLAEQLGN
jgi:dienelactone hydrolase